MPTFYLTGTSPSGERKSEGVRARSAAEARDKLISQGWSDLVLHTDDIMALHQKEIPDNPFTADEMIRMGRRTEFQHFCFMFSKFYRQAGRSSLLALILLVFGIWFQKRVPLIGGAIWLGSPGLLALYSSVSHRSKRRYDALLSAAAWYRWDEVERLLPRQSGNLPVEELAYRRAQMQIGKGSDVETVLREYSQAIRHANIPDWFALTRHAPLCLLAFKMARRNGRPNNSLEAQLVDRALNYYQQAIDMKPDQAVLMIDFAQSLLTYRQDVSQARKLLDAAQQQVLSELAQTFVLKGKGILALEENSPHDAVALLSEFLRQAPQLGQNPTMQSAIDNARAWLVLAHAAAGDEAQAREQYRICHARLQAQHETELLERCQRALGLGERDA